MSVYVTLLRSNPLLARLSVIQFICYFGAWFSHMAIYTLLIELGAPVWALSTAAAFTFLPSMLLAPFSGAMIDHVPTKALMLFLTLVEMLSVLILMWVDSLAFLWLLLGLIFVRMGAGSIYFQAEMSLLPKILDPASLKSANEIHSIIWSLSYALGMGIAGVYIHLFGITSAFVADFALYAVGFILLWRLPLPRLVQEVHHSVWVMMHQGFVYLKKEPKILHLMLLHAGVGLSAYDALVALLADYPYHAILSTALVIGFINATRALSLILGQLILGRWMRPSTLSVIFVCQGVGLMVWSVLQKDFYTGLIGVFICGLFTTALWSYTYTLLQVACEPRYYGRVIAYNDMLFTGMSTLVSFAIGGLFAYGVSLGAITLLLGLGFLFFGAYWQWFKHFHPFHN